MRQLCGALPSPITAEDRARDFHASRLFGGETSYSAQSVSISAQHEFYTQGSESCVPTSHVSSVNTLARIRGKPFARRPGAGRVFATTQIRQGLLIPGKGLANTGSSCGYALAEMRDTGAIADVDYPDTNDNASRVPPLDAMAAEVMFRITGAHRILFEEALDPVATLRTGLIAAMNGAKAGKNAAPTACMTVDDAYGNLPIGKVYGADVAPGGKVWGGHCQIITEYDAILDALGFATSWGDGRIYYVSIPWFARNGSAAFVIEDYAT